MVFRIKYVVAGFSPRSSLAKEQSVARLNAGLKPLTGDWPFRPIELCRVGRSPRLSKAGWLRLQENFAKPPKPAQTGRLVSSRMTSPCEPFLKERFAEIYKDASRRYQPPRLRVLTFLDRAATPPLKGGDSPFIKLHENIIC